jgi:hypothetical protein
MMRFDPKTHFSDVARHMTSISLMQDQSWRAHIKGQDATLYFSNRLQSDSAM